MTYVRSRRVQSKRQRRARHTLEALEAKNLLAGDTFAEPDGGWAYVFEGDGAEAGVDPYTALDGTWDHDNGSDAWDGTAIGEGLPGGVSGLTEGDTDFIRVQDPGDPRDTMGVEDPSNRKVYFTHLLENDFNDDNRPDNLDTIVDDGVTLHFRFRVATAATGPVDPLNSDGGTEEAPWPEDGLGYYQHNGGKSLIAIKQVDGPNVALGLARGSNVNEDLFTDADGNSQDGLILPHLLQDTETSNDSDPGESPETISNETGNVVTVDDVTEWQEFWVTIEAGSTTVGDFEDGTHIVNVYNAAGADPLDPSAFGITAATGNDDDSSYIAIGAGGTPRAGAFDVDFLAWAPGVHVPALGDGGGGGSDLADVTSPGDDVVRVDGENDGDGNDGPPPGGEMVDHVIDNITQKHLNFLDLNSGFTVTPSAGPSLVTGLRLYTANDAIERDPASYRLEGGLADGSFALISEGELALPDARNGGGAITIDSSLANQEVLFENTSVYTSYRLTFPTLKDAEAANSMQIAEVEFLGEIVLADVTAPGDPLVRVDGENDGDGSEGDPPAGELVVHVIDDVTQKHLNFLDLNSGFEVTPSAGATVLTGLRLYTANDAIERDPASYILEGAGADGAYTVISEGDLALPDGRNDGGDIPIDRGLVHQEISFENTEAYVSYRLTFPTLKDAEAANSMQIAEVEFLGSVASPIDLSAGTAAQSSQLGDFVAGNALDDVVNFTHTDASDENPTWQVLLPDAYAFDSVTIFNRQASDGETNCCPSRLRDITIQIVQFEGDVTTDFTGGEVTSSSGLLNPENTLGGGVDTAGPVSLTDNPGGAVGNLIRVIRTTDPDLSGTGGSGNNDEGSVLSLDLVLAEGTLAEPSELVGDIDGDGSVGFSDFLILSASFGTEVDPGTMGDLDGDGTVGFPDFLQLSANFGETAAAAIDAAFARGDL